MKTIANKPPVLDIGIINSDFSLSINTFAKPIPIENYSVCRQLLYDPNIPLTKTYVDGGHDHKGEVSWETHYHEVRLPPKMRRLLPGDKVLVAIIGNEFVVVDMIFDAKHLITGEPSWGAFND